MYERQLNADTLLTFGHEGLLYKDSFVMYDHQSESLWLHVTGEAVSGDFKGQKLRFFPSTLTTWQSWKRSYPQTVVLEGDRSSGFMGTFRGLEKDQHDRFGLAVFVPGRARLYPYPQLKSGVVLDELAGQVLLIAFSNISGVARCFVREVEDEVLTFEVIDDSEEDGFSLRDTETDSFWEGLSGEALEGAMAGEILQPVLCYPILVDRFSAFYPEGEIYGERPTQPENEVEKGSTGSP